MAPTVLVECTGQKESRKYAQKVLAPMMGKTKRFAKGYSSGIIQDFSHSVETIGETEGFGSSGRVDTEMTASEDSCAPKRKCISLNADRSNSFGVPLQVLPLSKISRTERKDLGMRLRGELERVRILQSKIALRGTNGVTMSSTSDIHSCSDVQKRPPLENFRKSSESTSGPGKRKVPQGRNGNGSRTKRGIFERVEPLKQTAPNPINTTNAMLMKQCETLLKRLMSHQFGWVFNTPVDVVKLNIPDYFTVIKYPMDLGTVKGKIASGAYTSPFGFLADVRLTFSNALTYNPPGNDFHFMADNLSKYFEVRWKSIEKKLLVTDTHPFSAKSNASRELEAAIPILPSKKRKTTSTDHKVKPEPVKQIMTDDEKLNLSKELEALLGEIPDNIVDFLRGHSSGECQNGEEEIEIDIDALSDDTLFMLRKLLDDYLRERQTEEARAGPSEMELLNESGLSNLTMQPCKGNVNVDEDVDIGGNDLPVSSYPPVEIEKDTAHRSSKCSSSSSSSSESGSSSYDSGSSSGSESDDAKASTPVNTAKVPETVSGAHVDQKRSNLGNPQDGNQSVSGLDQQEQNRPPKPISVEVDGLQEGESTPSQRQVSPDKLYRAAQLRIRFVDTILRAREKTLDQVEKEGDPEKLRHEREELERKQREEKARLQAEARAAEEARQQAEAEAAAEAKRKRELEREAARQALQKMEKTVEINENCQFLEDLEMLRAVPAEHLPSSVDETSPDHSRDLMGSFNLRGSSNPLEQLGLYMKMDEEEEEECVPKSVPDAVNDIEEGEID